MNMINAAPKPTIEGTENGELDLEQLEGKNLLAKIAAQPDEWKAGQNLQLIWAGTAADGTALDPVPHSHNITEQNRFNGIEITIENKHAKSALGGKAKVYYSVNFGLTSEVLEFNIVGNIETVTFNSPTVDTSVGPILNPDAIPAAGATARVKFQEAMGPGARIFLKYTVTNDNGNSQTKDYPVNFFPDKNDLIYNIDKDLIIAADGGKLELQYLIKTLTDEEFDSAKLELKIGYGCIPPNIATELDFLTSTHASITVPKYTGMAKDEIVLSITTGDQTYESSPQTADTLKDLTFLVPTGLYMGVFGNTVQTCYKVKRKVDEENDRTWTSEFLNWMYVDQGFPLNAPQYMSFADTAPRYTVKYEGVTTNDTVTIYWHAEGADLRQENCKIAEDSGYYYVPIPEQWMKDSKGKVVVGNYIYTPKNSSTKYFSPASVFIP